MSGEFLSEHDPILGELRELSPTGFVVALNVDWTGPKVLHSEFDPKWRKEYEEKNYFILDPVFYWTITRRGATRWSEIRFPDPAQIQVKARKYNMNFGAVFSDRSMSTRSFMTVSREDREYTEPEMGRLSKIFQYCLNTLLPLGDVDKESIHILKMLQDGATTAAISENTGAKESQINAKVKQMRTQFGAKNRAQLISVAAGRGLI